MGVAPKMAIFKRTSTSADWYVYHESLGVSSKLKLNTTDASSSSTDWNSTAPGSSVFTIGSGGGVNTSGASYVAYLFAEVEGFSSFGSYTGNGSADGPFIYTGFRPAFLVSKRVDSASQATWGLYDSARSPFNVTSIVSTFDLADAEYTGITGPDILSNGFKLRDTNAGRNASGSTYIYMAFAENPFKYANAR